MQEDSVIDPADLVVPGRVDRLSCSGPCRPVRHCRSYDSSPSTPFMPLEVGFIETVAIRKVWPTENADFTPWLQSHIGELDKVLGLGLSDPQREVGAPASSTSFPQPAQPCTLRPRLLLHSSSGDV